MYSVFEINKLDKKLNNQALAILSENNLTRDKNLDVLFGIFDYNNNLLGCGGCYKNTLRCIAIKKEHKGIGLANTLISHLLTYQYNIGNKHIFVYTKFDMLNIFQSLGFYTIASVNNKLVFLENIPNGFSDYLNGLQKPNCHGNIASLVMNLNPITLGHMYLIEKACIKNNLVYLFILSEDTGLIPFSTRLMLLKQATSHIKNLIIHKTGPYLISNATFPSYFIKDYDDVIINQAQIDIQIFIKIAKTLNINRRYAGSEPFSHVTNIYNSIIRKQLAYNNIQFIEIDRLMVNNNTISASTVREAIKNDNKPLLKQFLPQCAYEFFTSQYANDIINNIKNCGDVKHY